jgi:hypothetical protein
MPFSSAATRANEPVPFPEPQQQFTPHSVLVYYKEGKDRAVSL